MLRTLATALVCEILIVGLSPCGAVPAAAQSFPAHEADPVPVGILRARSLFARRHANPEWTRGAAPAWPIYARAGLAASRAGGISSTGLLEMSAVALTGAGHLATSEMDLSYVYIPLATAGWGAYAVHQARTEPAFGRRVGFTSHNLGPAFRDATLFALGAGALMAGYAALQDSLYATRNMAPLLALYPAWGLIQQFLVQGMFARNLHQGGGALGSPFVVVPASALLFGAVHLPNLELAAATFAMGLAFTPLYLRHGNLWPLGLYHGWLGVLFYYWVLQRDPMRYLAPDRRESRVRIHVGLGPAAAPSLRLRIGL